MENPQEYLALTYFQRPVSKNYVLFYFSISLVWAFHKIPILMDLYWI